MNRLIELLYEHLGILIVATLVVLFFCGLGYLITQDQKDQAERFSQCIAAGNQYINGNCLK